MSYTPKYTSEQDIESLLQISISSSTKPNDTDVEKWIEEIERGMDTTIYGSYATGTHPNGMKCDVLPIDSIPEGTINWLEYITTYGYTPSSGIIVMPPITPIITITAVYRNLAGLDADTDWELLTQGPGSGSSFIPLKKVGKQNAEQIWGLFFYQNLPSEGPQRVEIIGTYGYNIDAKILREYATLKVADKVLFSKIRTSDPGGLTMFTGGNLTRHVQVEWSTMRSVLKERAKEIEKLYFPSPKLRLAIL